MIWKRGEAERRRVGIVAELRQLQNELLDRAVRDGDELARIDAQFVSDMILYAEIGMNRMTLPDDWVDRTREKVTR